MTSQSPSPFRRWYPVGLAIVGAAASLAVYRRLPETMAVHWDIDSNPNGWMPTPKSFPLELWMERSGALVRA